MKHFKYDSARRYGVCQETIAAWRVDEVPKPLDGQHSFEARRREAGGRPKAALSDIRNAAAERPKDSKA